MASQAQLAGSLDIGRVISRGFQVLGSQFVTFIPLAVVLVGIPAVLLQLLMPTDTTDPTQALAAVANPLFWLAMLLNLLLASLLQVALVRAAILDIRGERVGLGELLVYSLKLLPSLIGITLLTGLGVVFGMILLIVPGIILLCMWSVAVPVLVEERLGVVGSMKRSAELTKGSRWWIFLLFVIYLIAGSIAGALFAGAGLAPAAAPSLLFIIVTEIASLAVNLVSLAVLASLYIELRLLKDGVTESGLAEIFA